MNKTIFFHNFVLLICTYPHFDRRVWFTNYSDGTCCQHVPFLILRLLDIYGFPLLSALDNVRLFNQFQYLIDIFVTRCFDSEFPLF